MFTRRILTRSFSTIANANSFRAGFCMTPHPAKVAKGGEDACVVTNNMIVVADGVGGWSDHGVDVAIYSRKLCADIEKLCDDDSLK